MKVLGTKILNEQTTSFLSEVEYHFLTIDVLTIIARNFVDVVSVFQKEKKRGND